MTFALLIVVLCLSPFSFTITRWLIISVSITERRLYQRFWMLLRMVCRMGVGHGLNTADIGGTIIIRVVALYTSIEAGYRIILGLLYKSPRLLAFVNCCNGFATAAF